VEELVRTVPHHPRIRKKSAQGLVKDLLGGPDLVSGPGDDAAVLDDGSGRRVVACGEALLPAFVEHDPFGAGVAAVLTNVNDLAATGAVPLGIVDTVVGTERLARQALRGMRHAADLYGVPVVGGHLTMSPGSPAISAFGVGTVHAPLSVTNVRAGQSLLVTCALGGEMRTDFPFYRAFDERGQRCAGDVRVLAELAGSGTCVAAKDVSMAGFVGSLSMLLEWGGFGAVVDLEALPTPDDVPLARWLCCFPSFAFLLCVPPGREQQAARPLRERGLAAEVVGTVDDSGTLSLAAHGRVRPVLDVVGDPATRLRRGGPW
jgi:selenophosphate synthetase-related protein